MPQLLPPRGIRNNNPGNIRHGSAWQGMAAVQDDPEFVTFVSPQYGYRAMYKILKHYILVGIITIQAMTSRWAPPNENNTDAYVKSLCDYTALAPTDVVPEASLPAMMKGITIHENGTCPWGYDVINEGIALA